MARKRRTFGQCLGRLRRSYHWTQADLAHRAGLGIGCIRQLEQGHRMPMLTTALRLAWAFNSGFDHWLSQMQYLEWTKWP